MRRWKNEEMKEEGVSRDEATLSERVSVRRSVCRSVTLSLFSLLSTTCGRLPGLVNDTGPVAQPVVSVECKMGES